MEKKRTFSFGKIAYCGKRKINEVVLEITLRNWSGYLDFTVCVDVWNNLHTDIVAGGQMIDDLYNEFPVLRANILYETIMRLWEKYHLKDVSNISAEDRELICLLFPEKDREEIKGMWKDRKDDLRG